MNKDFSKFQDLKRQAEKKVKIGGIITIIGALSFIVFMPYFFISFFIIVPGFIFIGVGTNAFSKISRTFKSEVLTQLVSSYVDHGVFNPNAGLSIGTVYSTEFVKRADRYHTEDFLSGEMDGVKFESSDVRLEERHVQHTKNGTRTYYETYFLGRIFVFDFNKSFDGYLQVLENGSPHSNRKYRKVKLESIQFNKKFRTYTTNEHSAFYVLTPHLMEALMGFEQNNKGKISFSFIDNLLYIGINNFKDTFELRMFREINEETFKEFERDLMVVKEVIHELRLNNRIFK